MAKKSFTTDSNPALQFISKETRDRKDREAGNLPADPIGKEPAGTAPPEGYRTNPDYIESKTKRLQALIQPSTHRDLKRIADRRGISVNEALNIALKQFIESEGV